MLAQAKIDLAVLYKLFDHAERDGEAVRPSDIARLFDVDIALRRIELALEQLEARGELERVYHPFYHEEGLWRISQDGLKTIEKAVRLPMSFIGRLHEKGDAWLDSDEAKLARLSNNPRYDEQVVNRIPFPSVSNDQTELSAIGQLPDASPSANKVNWAMWGAIAAIFAIPTMILLWWFS